MIEENNWDWIRQSIYMESKPSVHWLEMWIGLLERNQVPVPKDHYLTNGILELTWKKGLKANFYQHSGFYWFELKPSDYNYLPDSIESLRDCAR